MTLQSKAFRKFMNRAAHFDADVEMVDIVRRASERGALSVDTSRLFDDINANSHPRLTARKHGPQARSLVIGHLRTTLYASYIKDLYEDAMGYLSDILAASARHGLDPSRLVGENNLPFSANDLFAAKNWNGVVRMVSDAIFRALENERKTRKLLEKIDTKLNLKIDKKKIDDAMIFFDMRHLLVHSDGIVDVAFVNSYPRFKLISGEPLTLDITKIRRARSAVEALVKEYDDKIVLNKVIARADCN